MHPRQAIRNAVVNVLLGNPQANSDSPVYPLSDSNPAQSVGKNVFPMRPTPVWMPELPAVMVYTIEDDADDQDTEPKQYWRTVKLVVEAIVASNEGFDGFLDTIAEKIEALLLPMRFLKDPVTGLETADNLKLKKTEIVLKGQTLETVVGSCSIEIDVDYNSEVDYASPSDSFQKMGVTYKTTPDGYAPPVTDTVTLPGA